MVSTELAAGLGGLGKGLQYLIDEQYEINKKSNASKRLAKKLVAISQLPDDMTDDDKDILGNEIAKIIDPNTLQNVLNSAGSGKGQLTINIDGKGNKLRNSNIGWSIPILDPNRTQQDRKRTTWLSYHQAVNKATREEGISLEEAATKTIRKIVTDNPSQAAIIHEYINGTTAKTYQARQRMGALAGLLQENKNPTTNLLTYEVTSNSKNELMKLGLLDTPEKQALSVEDESGRGRLMQIILFDKNSPAYKAYNVYAYRGLTAGSEATVALMEESTREAENHANAFEKGMQNILNEEQVPESSADIPRDIMIKMQKENVMNPVVLNKLLTDAGQPPEIVIRRMAVRYVPDDSQQELRELIYRYLYNLAEGD